METFCSNEPNRSHYVGSNKITKNVKYFETVKFLLTLISEQVAIDRAPASWLHDIWKIFTFLQEQREQV